ncbi:MAG: serine/threonine protein kinase [Planctomycetes bacterium]|nr:serine/threonine protein kinase [Planctomycetota bacterium]
MQIRCSTCTRTVAIAETGVLPPSCPHCHAACVPERLGDYLPERLVATGGMGEVYLAWHRELGTRVALKVLPAMPLDAIDAVRERFAREARLTARVRHPGVVRVLHSDVAADRPFLVLEYVAGETLRARLARGPLPLVDACRCAAQVADVLAAAHHEGVLHRDVKPDNVMLQDDGAVRVLDFGIARAIADDTQLTRTGEIVGTPEYMAPEQLLDGPEATDERTDVHALGVLLYESLTGRSPFRGANLFQALKLVESLVPPPPSTLVAAVPPTLDAVLAAALEKRREDRLPSAAAFAAAVRDAVPAARATTPPIATPAAWRSWLIAAVLVLCGAAMPLVARLWAGPPPPAPFSATDATQPTSAELRARSAAAAAKEAHRALQQDLHDGLWCRAAQRAATAAADRSAAREAFVAAHALWLRAAGLPSWLAVTDLGERRRLFGDLLEPVDDVTEEELARLAGDPAAWRRWLVARPDDDAAVSLWHIAELPAQQRAPALEAFAVPLPPEQPEPWLARTIARHLHGDAAGARQAAEMAWLCGGGEAAVLLHAALARKTATDAPARGELWRLLARSDARVHPASTLLMLRLEADRVAGVEFDARVAASFPAALAPQAAQWFVGEAAEAEGSARLRLLQLAVALGARPDYTTPPWRELGPRHREALNQEGR